MKICSSSDRFPTAIGAYVSGGTYEINRKLDRREQFARTVAIAQPPRYSVRDLGAVGANPGQPFFLTNNGLVSGAAASPDGTEHAVFWFDVWKGDFGPSAFGGPNSIAFGANERGQAVGEADTSTADPNQEDFCGFKALGLPSRGTTCMSFLWQNGVMTPLPTLGGNAVQGRNVNGTVQELPTLSGDLDGEALAINDSGQVAGGSGECAAFNPNSLVNLQPLHAMIWRGGVAMGLDSLGGTGHGNGILAVNLNNQGQVIGNSDLPGDTNFHGFLWTEAECRISAPFPVTPTAAQSASTMQARSLAYRWTPASTRAHSSGRKV